MEGSDSPHCPRTTVSGISWPRSCSYRPLPPPSLGRGACSPHWEPEGAVGRENRSLRGVWVSPVPGCGDRPEYSKHSLGLKKEKVLVEVVSSCEPVPTPGMAAHDSPTPFDVRGAPDRPFQITGRRCSEGRNHSPQSSHRSPRLGVQPVSPAGQGYFQGLSAISGAAQGGFQV